MSSSMAEAAPGSSAAEVRRVDQERINEFGKLNKRLMELRADIKQVLILESATTLDLLTLPCS